MRLALVATIALACRTGTPSAPTPTGRAPYLPLFEAGRAFSLTGKLTSRTQPVATPTDVRCTVVESKQIGDANVSRVACDAPHGGLLVAGTWVSSPPGLYHPSLPVDDPDELALLGDDDLLISAVPTERDHEHALEQAEERVEAFDHRGSWCVRQTTTAGLDRRSFALCFDGTNITGGADFSSSGDDWQHVEFGVVPPPDDDDE